MWPGLEFGTSIRQFTTLEDYCCEYYCPYGTMSAVSTDLRRIKTDMNDEGRCNDGTETIRFDLLSAN